MQNPGCPRSYLQSSAPFSLPDFFVFGWFHIVFLACTATIHEMLLFHPHAFMSELCIAWKGAKEGGGFYMTDEKKK